MRLVHWALGLCLLVSGCAPSPPTIIPERVDVISAGSSGLGFRIHCQAHNPNRIPLPTKRAEAKISLGTSDLGYVVAPSLPTLGPKSATPVDLDLTVPWHNIATAIGVAFADDNVPYSISGNVRFDAAGVELMVPFSQQGTIRKAEILAGVNRSMRFHVMPDRLPLLPSPPGQLER